MPKSAPDFRIAALGDFFAMIVTLAASQSRMCVAGMVIESRNILDLLSQLVHRSLVMVETSGNGGNRDPTGESVRYRGFEIIHRYAMEELGGEVLHPKAEIPQIGPIGIFRIPLGMCLDFIQV